GVVVGAVTTGGGGTGKAFSGTGAMSAPAGGFPPAGDVTTPSAFPPGGVVGTSVGGAAMLGATGATVSGFPPEGDVKAAGGFPPGVVTGAPGSGVAAPGVTAGGFPPNAGATGAP